MNKADKMRSGKFSQHWSPIFFWGLDITLFASGWADYAQAHYIMSQPNCLTFQQPWCPTPACAASKQELQAWALHTNKVETLVELKVCYNWIFDGIEEFLVCLPNSGKWDSWSQFCKKKSQKIITLLHKQGLREIILCLLDITDLPD